MQEGMGQLFATLIPQWAGKVIKKKIEEKRRQSCVKWQEICNMKLCIYLDTGGFS